MKEKSEGIHGQIVADRCQSRIKQVQEIATSFHFSLPHPHDFHPSAADICWIPEVRKTILDGTDAEFQDCIDDIQSRISELSATWLEERRNTFLRLLPQDPPTPMHLSLATTIFDCERCHKSPMHIEEALYHYCYSSEGDILRGTKFLDYRIQPNYNHDIGSPWNPRVAKYSYSATLAALIREIVLECGENPDTITTQEMNRKHHRFVRFDNYQSTIIVRNWVQAVSSGAWPPDNAMTHPCHAARLRTSAFGHAYTVGSSSLMNYRSLNLNRRNVEVIGAAFAVGELMIGAPDCTTRGSRSSKIISLSRKSFPYLLHMVQTVARTSSDLDLIDSPGTRLRTRLKKIASTSIQITLLHWNADLEKVIDYRRVRNNLRSGRMNGPIRRWLEY